VFATDVSPAALAIAARNAARHGVARRVTFVETSMLEGIPPVDVVLSNPPYVEARNRAGIMPDVWAYEPQSALYGGDMGLDAVRALISQVAARTPAPPLVLEFGSTQAEAVRAAAGAAGLRVLKVDERAWVAVLARDHR
jgi:release factor glutamine methyltransferase